MRKLYIICLLALFVTTNSFVGSTDGNYTDGSTKITSFYPNPATSYINFEFAKPLEKGYSIAIYNFIGKKVTEFYINTTRTTISLDGFFRGIYIFQLRDKNGKIVESGKFQVNK